jgi:hypothetical protein
MVNINEAMVYDHFVKAIMDEKCVSCHNPDKAKGKLILTSAEGLMKGGKDGKLFEPGNPDESLLMKRFHLPLEDKKHMPPKNKPQLSDDEIDIVKYWIKSGGDFSKHVIELPPDDTLRRLLEQRMLSSSSSQEEVYTFAPADEGTIQKLNTAYRVVEPLSLNSPALSVNIYNATEYKSSLLNDLTIVQTQIVSLDLNKLPVTDDDLKTIGKFENLRRLNLNFTNITGATMSSLHPLKHLEYLSLSSTQVKPEHLHDLAPLENLKRIYLWNTTLTTDDIDKLRGDLRHVVIETGFVPDHSKKLHLPPPRIENDQKIYSKDFTISITHPVKGTEIRYTLDGTEPDSVNGMLYEGPISGTSSTTSLKAVAYKEGWWGSESTGGTFYKTADAPPVVVVDRLLADKYFPGSDPLTGRLGRGGDDGELWPIVGVVEPVKIFDLERPVEKETIYLLHRQMPSLSMTFALRTAGDPEALVEPFRRTILDIDPDQPVFGAVTMQEQIRESLVTRRVSMFLLVSFGALAVVLAAVGVYGVLAFSVSQRQREIGTRMALGARPMDVLGLVARQGLAMTGLGLVLGLAGALALGRFASSLLFGVTPWDPATLAAVTAVLLVIATFACLRPARRAAKVDPMEALRD